MCQVHAVPGAALEQGKLHNCTRQHTSNDVWLIQATPKGTFQKHLHFRCCEQVTSETAAEAACLGSPTILFTTLQNLESQNTATLTPYRVITTYHHCHPSQCHLCALQLQPTHLSTATQESPLWKDRHLRPTAQTLHHIYKSL